jgi:hypothetical protein
MTKIDWNAPAKLIERQDAGSDLYFDFNQLSEGALVDLVRAVVAKPAADRARLVIDAGGVGTFNIGDILALAAREDFPS